MISQDALKRIVLLLDTGHFNITVDAQNDILKQGYNWSKDFIIDCMRNGKMFYGYELYPYDEARHTRYYCIHRLGLLSRRLILIGFILLDDILIIHISPLNPGSKEGRAYYLG